MKTDQGLADAVYRAERALDAAVSEAERAGLRVEWRGFRTEADDRLSVELLVLRVTPFMPPED